MERLDKIIVCETDKGNYAVRLLNWADVNLIGLKTHEKRTKNARVCLGKEKI